MSSSSLNRKNASELFGAFNSKDMLQCIAEAKGLDISEKSRKDIIKDLIAYVKRTGLEVLFRTLKVATVKDILTPLKIQWGDEPNKPPPNSKVHLARTLVDTIGEKAKSFLEKKISSSLKREILVQLSVPIPDKAEDYVPTILEEAEYMGLEHLFSGFSIDKLREFCKSCGVEAPSQSFDVVMDCILTLEDYEPPKKKEKKEPPKRKKPPIDLNISESELVSCYLRDELAEWLQSHHVSTAGPKKFLAQKIYATLRELPLPELPVKPTKKKSGAAESEEESSKKRTRSSEDSSDKSPKKKLKTERTSTKDESEEEEEENKKPRRSRSKKDDDSDEYEEKKEVKNSRRKKKSTDSSDEENTTTTKKSKK